MKKLTAFLLAMCMVLSLIPATAFAAEAEQNLITAVETKYSNTIYNSPDGAHSAGEELIWQDAEAETIDPDDYPHFYSLEDAAKYARQEFGKRSGQIQYMIHYTGDFAPDKVDVSGILFDHTGVPTEGDYMERSWSSASHGYADFAAQHCTLMTYRYTYYTNQEQEEALTAEVNRVLEELHLEGKTNYEKTKRIYDYIIRNIVYDYDNLGDSTYKLKYTAYAALVNKTAVCQGYAALLYRMLLQEGIDCRYISGVGNGGRHGWNIAKVGDFYYNLDSTWDAEYQKYGWTKYFLVGSSGFTDHAADTRFTTEEFTGRFPVNEISFSAYHVHQNTEQITAPTCTEGGYSTFVCVECGNVATGSFTNALGHAAGQNVTAYEACRAFTCTRCRQHVIVWQDGRLDGLNLSKTAAISMEDHGAYPWVRSGTRLQSGNQRQDSTTSETVMTFVLPYGGKLGFSYGVSSEDSWDKLTITLNGSIIAGAISGLRAGTFSRELEPGTYKLTMSYSKDPSVSKNEDIGFIDNLVLQATPGKELKILTQPEDFVGNVGDAAMFHVEADGEGLDYQWYLSVNEGKSWGVCGNTGAATDTLRLTMLASRVGYQYKCVITDAAGKTVETNAVALRKLEMPEPEAEFAIAEQPADFVGAVGSSATFQVKATGEGLTYQWFFSVNEGKSWSKCGNAGSTTDTLKISMLASRVGYWYKCVITDAKGAVLETKAVSMGTEPRVETPADTEFAIVQQPADHVGEVGSTARFAVRATGEGLTYQWFFSVNEGKSWSACGNAGSTTDTLQLTMLASRVGYQYKCIITDAKGATLETNAVLMSTEPKAEEPVGTEFAIVEQPADYVGEVGSAAAFHVGATGEGLTYQWYLSANGGKSWVKSGNTGNTTDTLRLTMLASRVGYLFKCIVTDARGETLETVPAYMGTEPRVEEPVGTEFAIVEQPADYIGEVGSAATFQVRATGEGLTYQWYLSANGGKSWSRCGNSGAATDTLRISMTSSRVGYQYRCIISDGSGQTLESNPASMRVG